LIAVQNEYFCENYSHTENCCADFCSEDTLEQLIQSSHQIIHKAVLHPRHTWSKPIWVLRGETQIYIVQDTRIEAAIAKVKTQHPQETGKLEVITVGGILAPDQVISLDTNLLQSLPPK